VRIEGKITLSEPRVVGGTGESGGGVVEEREKSIV